MMRPMKSDDTVAPGEVWVRDDEVLLIIRVWKAYHKSPNSSPFHSAEPRAHALYPSGRVAVRHGAAELWRLHGWTRL